MRTIWESVRVDAFMRDVLSSDIDERALTEIKVKEPKDVRQAVDSVVKHYLSDLDDLIQFDGLVAETLKGGIEHEVSPEATIY